MSADPRWPLHLFGGIGVELEYMIVDAQSLSVSPIADQLLAAEAGSLESDLERGPIAWSNELVLHVIELKTNGPAPALAGQAEHFQSEVDYIHERLAPLGARLMPSGMHPWMDPEREMRLWPHECGPIYQAFHHIFNCRGHGWSNLQSTHLNLPFGDAEEFGRLHAAIRFLLPLLPALTASTPAFAGQLSPDRDTRLRFYSTNARRVPSVAGRVVPESVTTPEEYQAKILDPIYRDLARWDPDGILRHEWANARGAIARFERGAIEIRILDIQECPQADLALASAIVATLRALVAERGPSRAAQDAWSIDALAAQLQACIRDAERAPVDPDYARAFGISAPRTAGELWRDILSQWGSDDADVRYYSSTLEHQLRAGTLATRLVERLGPQPKSDRLRAVYEELCDCLKAGRLFE